MAWVRVSQLQLGFVLPGLASIGRKGFPSNPGAQTSIFLLMEGVQNILHPSHNEAIMLEAGGESILLEAFAVSLKAEPARELLHSDFLHTPILMQEGKSILLEVFAVSLKAEPPRELLDRDFLHTPIHLHLRVQEL